MDHKDNVDRFIAGNDLSMPMEEIPKFYRRLIETLDLMGNRAITKPANPLGIAYSLQYVARDYVLSVDGGIKAQQIGRQKNFAYQKERAAGYGSPFLLVF